jgi:hypothetical protein
MEELFNINDIGQHINCVDLDYDKKVIGDRVQVIDYSSVSHRNGLPLEWQDFEELDGLTVFIVIETSKKVQYKAQYNTYIQDVVIVNTKLNKQYRVMSNHLKLFLIKNVTQITAKYAK